MRTPLGPTQRVRNIEASVFQRCISGRSGDEYSVQGGTFYGSGYAMAVSGLLRRLLIPSQRLNLVPCNIESSG